MKRTALVGLALLMSAQLSSALQPDDPVKINEVYYGYPPGYNVYQDQFVELYNAGQETCYLDGAMICRGIPSELFSAWCFPGEVGGTDISLEPGQFLLIAKDAYDFQQINSASVNLTYADWESYHPFEEPPGDNPDVPNLEPAWECVNDFTMANQVGQVLLATGTGLYVEPGSG